MVDPFKNLREKTASKGNLPNEGATPVSSPIIPNIEKEIVPPTSSVPIDQSLHVPKQSEADESNPNVEIRETPSIKRKEYLRQEATSNKIREEAILPQRQGKKAHL